MNPTKKFNSIAEAYEAGYLKRGVSIKIKETAKAKRKIEGIIDEVDPNDSHFYILDNGKGIVWQLDLYDEKTEIEIEINN